MTSPPATSVSGAGPPRKIVVIRHGEKPPKAGPPPSGVREDGSEHRGSLVVRGWQRAGALVPFFSAPWDPAIACPAHLFSPPPHGADGDHGRPYQTLAALGAKLGLEVDVRFVLDAEDRLVADALARAGVVLIAWEHMRIARIANLILRDATTAPQAWPDDRFDLAWIFDLQPGGGYGFSQRPQLLLAGDRPDVVSTSG